MYYQNLIEVGTTTYTEENLYGGVSYRFDLCSGDQIELGETPSAEIKFTIDHSIPIGTEIRYDLKESTSILYSTIGYFYVSESKRNASNINLWDITAYDSMSLLDKDASDWNESIFSWRSTPHSITEIVRSMADYTGISIDWSLEAPVPVNINQNILVTWPQTSITYRTILKYISAFCGGYAVGGGLRGVGIRGFGSRFTVTKNNDSWSKRVISEYSVPVIDQLVIKAVEGDVGYKYPATEGNNQMLIMGNPIWYNDNLQTATQNVYNIVHNIPNYTPTTVKLFDPIPYRPPFTLTTIKDNVSTTSLITNISWDLSGCTCESKGLSDRGKASEYVDTEYMENRARYNKFTRDLNSTVSEIANLDGDVSTLTQTVNGLTTTVSKKISTYSQAVEPTEKTSGDLWYFTGTTTSTMTNGKWYRWNGNNWVEVTDSEVDTNASNISTLQQTATSLTSRITSAEGSVNQIEQTLNGVVFTDSETGETVIDGSYITTGTIEANRIDLVGNVDWNDLSSSCQSRVDQGKGGSYDDNDVKALLRSTYQIDHTSADGTSLQSPTIYAGEIYSGHIYGDNVSLYDMFNIYGTDLNGGTALVGQIGGVKERTTDYKYAYLKGVDNDSQLKISTSGTSNPTTVVEISTGDASIDVSQNSSYSSAGISADAVNILGLNYIYLGGTGSQRLVLGQHFYGSTLPASGTQGQLFFKI